MTTKDFSLFVGTPFTVNNNGSQTNFQINKYPSNGPDLKQSMRIAYERSTLNSRLEGIFKLPKGYFGEESNAVLLSAENVKQQIKFKGNLFYALRNVMDPDDCAYVLDDKAEKNSSATLLRRVSSHDEPLVLVACKPELAANSVIMELAGFGTESATPQTKTGKLLRKTGQS
jgi:hypothetical protein